jgi:hypothetical protein
LVTNSFKTQNVPYLAISSASSFFLLLLLPPLNFVVCQGPLRIALASTFTLQVLYIALSPAVRLDIQGWPFLAAIVVVFWLTFPFAI